MTEAVPVEVGTGVGRDVIALVLVPVTAGVLDSLGVSLEDTLADVVAV